MDVGVVCFLGKLAYYLIVEIPDPLKEPLDATRMDLRSLNGRVLVSSLPRRLDYLRLRLLFHPSVNQPTKSL
jgi:hypothetical protein